MATITEKPLSPAQRTLGAVARLDALKASGLSADERQAEIRRAYAGDGREG